MSKKRALIFPGQGAQVVGMGRDFYEQFSIARETFEEADDILGRSLSKIIFEGPQEELTRTDNCQVAIYVTSIALFRVVREQFPDLEFDFCAGLSLGEYTALTAAGAISFADCLPLVEARASFMHKATVEFPGTMVVVLGHTPEELAEKLAEMPHKAWIANLNCPGQVVLAGTKEGMNGVKEGLLARGVKTVLPLDVAGAFHSPLMERAQDQLSSHIENAPLSMGEVKVVMNAKGAAPTSLAELRKLLVEQVTSPVYWEKGIRVMEGEGVTDYLEIGPGKSLTGMNKRIGVSGLTMNVEKMEDLDQLAERLGDEIYETALK